MKNFDFIKYSHLIMGERTTQVDILCHKVKFPSARNGITLVELLAKGVSKSSPKITDYCQSYCLSSTTRWGGPIDEDTTYLDHQTWRS